MAQGDSITSICNIAMIALSEALVVNVFPPDPNKRAILCNARYDQVRRAVLRAHPWNCNRRPVQLAASTTSPPFWYSNAYPLPADYLRVDDIGEHDTDVTWEVVNLKGVGPCVVTDETAPLNVWYGFDLTDPTQFDALLVEQIGLALAAKLAYPLGRQQKLKEIVEQEREGQLAIARLVGSQENSAKEWDEDIWLRSRR